MIPQLQKSHSHSSSRSQSFVGFFDFLDGTNRDLQAHIAILYYTLAAPVATAIDILSEEFADLEPRVFNTKTKEFEDHDVLELLQKPNADSTYTEFAQRLAGFLLITGDSYILGSGPVSRPPLEIAVVNPADITLQADGKDGLLGTIQFNADVVSAFFIREEVERRFRFFNKEETGEAWQIKTFNPRFSSSNLGGMSPLQPIMPEIEQYLESSNHNLSLLKRGARPSGVFTSADQLTDDQFERLKEQIDNWYSGSGNAGRPILAENGTSYADAMINNRDMDFLNLKKEVTLAIYARLRIPLPIISSDNMTLANMESSKLSLYDNATMPLANRLFQELTNFLMPRYRAPQELIITFDPSQVESLTIRRAEEVKLRRETAVNTVNELRTRLGDEALDSGGDVLLRPATLVPVATDQFTEDQFDVPPREKFINILEAQKTADGKRRFSDAEILAYAAENGF